MMKRTIKLTEKQLREAASTFEFLSNGDAKAFSGQSEISADGKLSDEEYGEPVTSDDIESDVTPQGYIRFTSMSGRANRLSESESEDENGDGVDDFYNNKELDILGNQTKNDNLTKIPSGVEYKLNVLMSSMRENKLTQKQCAIVLNKMLEAMNFSELPYAWKKELRLKIK